jgi:hypothetical protein
LITIFAPYENPQVSITVIIESAPYEMNAANYASREIISYYFGERLRKEKENSDQASGENNVEIQEIIAPDGIPATIDNNPEEVILPPKIEEENGE